MLLYQVQGESEAADRFYSAFYRKLLDANFSNISKHAQFFNLVFRILKNDPNPTRMIAISKRLLQLSLQQSPNLICSMLYLLSELIKFRPQDAKFLEKVLETSTNQSKFDDEDSDDADDDYKVDIDSGKMIFIYCYLLQEIKIILLKWYIIVEVFQKHIL